MRKKERKRGKLNNWRKGRGKVEREGVLMKFERGERENENDERKEMEECTKED